MWFKMEPGHKGSHEAKTEMLRQLQVTGPVPRDCQPGSRLLGFSGSQLCPGSGMLQQCFHGLRKAARPMSGPAWGPPQPPPRGQRRALPQTGTGLCSGMRLPVNTTTAAPPWDGPWALQESQGAAGPVLTPPVQRLAEEDLKRDRSGTSPPSP